MYVCMYVCTYVCLYVCMHAMYVCMYVCIDGYMYIASSLYVMMFILPAEVSWPILLFFHGSQALFRG